MRMRYLVTGGAGFIGSNIVAELVKEGKHVRVFDDLSTGKKENLTDVMKSIEFVQGDIRDAGVLGEAMRGVDVVLHQAALPSVPRSVRDPLSSHEVNATGTLNVLIAAREAGVRRVVNASSSSVYGDSPALPKHEEMATNPLSPYAVSKLAAERYCSVFARLYGMETVSLRYFNVFGPRQDPQSQYAAVIPKFITSMLKKDKPVIFGDGEQSRDFTYVANVVQANLLAATATFEYGYAVNCSCGHRITLNELVGRINGLVGTSLKARHDEERAGDIKHSLGSIELAKKLFGYEPSVSFDEGLKKTITWYQRV